ncbi:MAG: coproporphyrinogen III oxidase, partial [Pseudomonadota bacterium]|nr:coproporphyrinogen III oxidase [Pseudomonadota bacterium]
SAISAFPDLLVQNEKAAGAYRDRMATGQAGACRGVIRTPDDQARGRVIESLLCRGEAHVGALPLPDLSRFEELGLLRRQGSHVTLHPTALPYARAIASTFDAYLEPREQRFSHAV